MAYLVSYNMKDFYEILGVSETANDSELKSAFRKAAIQHHPDKNPGNKEAESKFKEINEAYQILSDPQKRAIHDHERKYGPAQQGPQQWRHGGFNPQGFDFGFNNGGQTDPHFEDVIRQFFEQAGGSPFGRQQQPRQNRHINAAIEITLEDAFTGKNFPLAFEHAGNKLNVAVAIPAGITHGTRMRYQGFGEKNIPNVPPGDLYVTIHISEHSVFTRDRSDLRAELKVNAIDAMIGASVNFNCIDGTVINIDIPAGTQNNTVFRVPNKGMTNYQAPTQRGSMLLTVAITIPTNLTEYDIKRLTKIAKNIQS